MNRNYLTLALLVALLVTAEGERYVGRRYSNLRYNAPQQILKDDLLQTTYIPSTEEEEVPYYVTHTQFSTQTKYTTQMETVTVTQTQLVPRYKANRTTVTLQVMEKITHPVTTSVTLQRYVTVDRNCPVVLARE